MDTIVVPIGTTVESFIALIKEEVLGGIKIDSREVEEFFTVPISHFKKIGVEKYYVRLEIQPSFVNERGEEVTLLPKPWGGKKYRVLAYKSDMGLIWGITAEIIYELINRTEGRN